VRLKAYEVNFVYFIGLGEAEIEHYSSQHQYDTCKSNDTASVSAGCIKFELFFFFKIYESKFNSYTLKPTAVA
jgi:hypothetical protein